jgi:DNA-binding NarL/FixJ family response regulator
MSLNIAVLGENPSLDGVVERLKVAAPDITFSARSASWAGVNTASAARPDIVLLDFETDDAIQLIREIRSQGIRVVTISSRDDPKAVIRAMAAGADASMRTTDRSRDMLVQLRLSASRAALISGRI